MAKHENNILITASFQYLPFFNIQTATPANSILHFLLSLVTVLPFSCHEE